MVTFAALGADASAGKPIGKSVEVDVDIDNRVDVRDLIEGFGLRERSRETVEEVTVFRVVLEKAKSYDFDGYFVGNELTLVDIRLSRDADWGLLLDVLSELF